ncbi:MAG: hypothetical protein M4579_001340 [Chaenotheca gracillima]|nr:MAG: hypothetical protein M4579_001340 [Chaenotheca gracillima]
MPLFFLFALALELVEGRDQNSTAVDAYQIEVETTSLIRAAEELLTTTRSLKEAWLFGQLDTLRESKVTDKTDEDAQATGDAFLRVMKNATQEKQSKSD